MYSIQVGLDYKGNLWKAYGNDGKQYKIIPTTLEKIKKLVNLKCYYRKEQFDKEVEKNIKEYLKSIGYANNK